MTPNHYKSIWLSDIHLGCKDCKAEFLLEFLETHHAERLFLVGDIVDFWALSRRVHWPESHNKVLNTLLRLARRGTRVIYVPGNHDEVMRPYAELLFGGIEIHEEFIHETVTGKKMLLLHGDKFDAQVCLGRFHAKLGDALYDFLLFLNRHCHALRKTLGLPYWSLASYIKTKVKKANEAIRRYQKAAIQEAKRQSTDGVVCGHIHHPELNIDEGILYCNDGDWVENCTTLVETHNGDIQLLRWSDATKSTEVISQANWGRKVDQLDENAA